MLDSTSMKGQIMNFQQREKYDCSAVSVKTSANLHRALKVVPSSCPHYAEKTGFYIPLPLFIEWMLSWEGLTLDKAAFQLKVIS